MTERLHHYRYEDTGGKSRGRPDPHVGALIASASRAQGPRHVLEGKA